MRRAVTSSCFEKSSGTAAQNPFPESCRGAGIGAIARLPSSKCRQNGSVVPPIGETTPIPVTATCSTAPHSCSGGDWPARKASRQEALSVRRSGGGGARGKRTAVVPAGPPRCAGGAHGGAPAQRRDIWRRRGRNLRRSVRRRVERAARRGRPRGGGSRSKRAARRRIQAAHVAVLISRSWRRGRSRCCATPATGYSLTSSPKCSIRATSRGWRAMRTCCRSARATCKTFALLREVGATRTPVLLKRGLSATVQEWLLAAEYVMLGGNENVVLCERGIRSFDVATRNLLDIAVVPLLEEMTHLPVIVDPSHAMGIARLVPPIAVASIAAGAHGLLIEVHPDPANALSDGAQSLDCEQFERLMAGSAGVAEIAGRRLPKRYRAASSENAANPILPYDPARAALGWRNRRARRRYRCRACRDRFQTAIPTRDSSVCRHRALRRPCVRRCACVPSRVTAMPAMSSNGRFGTFRFQ